MPELHPPRPPTYRAPLPVLWAAVFAVVGTVLGVSAHHLVAEGPAPWRQSVLAALVLLGVGLSARGVPARRLFVTSIAYGATAGTHPSW